MSDSSLSYFEARRSLLAGFIRKVQLLGTYLVGPVTVVAYAVNAWRHPCWQAYVLLAAALAMNAAWTLGFSLATAGRAELGSALVALPGIAFCGMAMLLRENRAVAEAVASLGMMGYVALISRRVLLPTMVAGTAVILLGIVLPLLGLAPQMKTPILEQVLFDLTYAATMFPVAFFFHRAGQSIGEELFRENEATSLVQSGVLQKVQRIEPELASAVGRIQQTAGSLTDRAREQSSASSEVHATSERLMQMVAASAEAAQETRAIAEKTRDDSVASVGKLQRVEQDFQQAVARIDQVRSHIDELASRISQTEELNETLGDIAENLKMLGLNASLEATRAGEKGQGFQVVALELRRMVDQSGQDLVNSRALLAGVRERAAEIAKDAEASTAQLQSSFNELRNTAALVQGIAGSFAKTSEKVDSIAKAAEQQRAQIGDISSAMQGFERATLLLGEATSTLEGGVGMITGAHHELQAILAQRQTPRA
ncbi:MAG TPA: methyl-accepting chemotaxis protein [Myxococcales bacterium]